MIENPIPVRWKITLLCVVLPYLLPVLAYGADTVVLSGVPTTKVESSNNQTSHFTLPENQKSEFRLLSVKRDGKYFWATREYRPLLHTVSGAFHYFTELRGGGYIKVVDRRVLLEEKTPRFLYMEHLTLWLETLTYWGTADNP